MGEPEQLPDDEIYRPEQLLDEICRLESEKRSLEERISDMEALLESERRTLDQIKNAVEVGMAILYPDQDVVARRSLEWRSSMAPDTRITRLLRLIHQLCDADA